MKILIFEDEYLIATALELHLNSLGYKEIYTTDTLEKATKVMEENYPDIAILDIRIPNDHEAGIKIARSLNQKKSIPIIFMTAHNDDDIVEKALGTKPNAYLSKSFNQKIILRTIESAIESLAQSKNAGIEKSDTNDSYFFNTDEYILIKKHKGVFHKVELKDILYVHSEAGLVEIVAKNMVFSHSSTLPTFLKQVDDNRFIKVSRNYVINIHHFNSFHDNNYIQVDDIKIRLSQTEFKKLFSLFKVFKTKHTD